MTLVVFCFFATASGFGDLCGLPSRGACFAAPSRLGFLIFNGTGCSAGWALSPERRADRLLLGAGSSAGGSKAGVFLRRVSLAAVGSGGSEDWFAPRFLAVLALENMKPSRSSSYTAHNQRHPIQRPNRHTWILSARRRAANVIGRGVNFCPFLRREPRIFVEVDPRNSLSLLALCLRHAQGLERRARGY
jgi:hypothetical protein